ncbi:MAG TPA: hypothetical protein VND91_07335 [Candidatus Saccharimonadia bacterium]|nr:hypothetical protein [Candidatus Saccharimonadia bacterium]
MAIVAGLALALAACGGGNEDRAVAACEKAVADKLSGKVFELDRGDMRAKLQATPDGLFQINSTVVFDKDLPSESKQTFDCRVKFDPANASAEPAIVGLQFTW